MAWNDNNTLGSYSSVITDGSTHLITGGGTYTTPIVNVANYQSYAIGITSYCGTQNSSNNQPLCIPVTINWFADSAGAFLVDSTTYWYWLCNNPATAFNFVLRGTGPMRGAYCSIVFGNPVATGSYNLINLQFFGSSRAAAFELWQQTPPLQSNIADFGLGLLTSVSPFALNGSDGILANEVGNVLVGAQTQWFPLPLYTGQISIYFSTGTALNHSFAIGEAAGLVSGAIVAGASAPGIVFQAGNVASTVYTADLTVARSPLYMVVSSTASGATFTVTVEGSPNT